MTLSARGEEGAGEVAGLSADLRACDRKNIIVRKSSLVSSSSCWSSSAVVTRSTDEAESS